MRWDQDEIPATPACVVCSLAGGGQGSRFLHEKPPYTPRVPGRWADAAAAAEVGDKFLFLPQEYSFNIIAVVFHPNPHTHLIAILHRVVCI